MASLNLAGKTAGYVKITAPDDSSNNPVVTLPTESGELALKSDIGEGGGGSGGGVEAQPPVAFNYSTSTNVSIAGDNVNHSIIWDEVNVDTDTCLSPSGEHYVVKKEGLYNLSCQFRPSITPASAFTYIDSFIRVVDSSGTMRVVARSGGYPSSGTTSHNMSCSAVVDLKVGDKVYVDVKLNSAGDVNFTLISEYNNFSGHMVSSITEGEVKEKEAEIFYGYLGSTQTINNNNWTTIKLDTVDTDTQDGFNSSDNSYTPKVAGWYQINSLCGLGQSVSHMYTRVKVNGIEKIRGNIGTPGSDSGSSTNSSANGIVYLNGTTDKITLEVIASKSSGGTSDLSGNFNTTYLSAHLITGQSSGGGSGGGDYTPEKMVWEDKKAEREFDTVYTNTNDVPLYLSVNTKSNLAGNGRINLRVDGVSIATVGASAESSANILDNVFTVVPSGSTYEIKSFDLPELFNWYEARMPVAVGTGGKGLVEDKGTWAITNNGDATGSIGQQKAGYVRIGSQVTVWGQFQVEETFTNSIIGGLPFKVENANSISNRVTNGVIIREGLTSAVVVTTMKNSNNLSFHNNGNIDEDYLLDKNTRLVRFSLTYITDEPPLMGDSGDSIWTEEDGRAVYDGNVAVNGNLITNKGRDGGVHLSDDGLNNDFFPVSRTASKLGTWGTVRVHTTKDHEGLRIIGDTGQSQAFFMVVDSTGTEKFKVDNTGAVTSNSKALALTEEVDKKLAIKDKLIEKLEARLDKLEAKLKK